MSLACTNQIYRDGFSTGAADEDDNGDEFGMNISDSESESESGTLNGRDDDGPGFGVPGEDNDEHGDRVGDDSDNPDSGSLDDSQSDGEDSESESGTGHRGSDIGYDDY